MRRIIPILTLAIFCWSTGIVTADMPSTAKHSAEKQHTEKQDTEKRTEADPSVTKNSDGSTTRKTIEPIENGKRITTVTTYPNGKTITEVTLQSAHSTPGDQHSTTRTVVEPVPGGQQVTTMTTHPNGQKSTNVTLQQSTTSATSSHSNQTIQRTIPSTQSVSKNHKEALEEAIMQKRFNAGRVELESIQQRALQRFNQRFEQKRFSSEP